MGQHRTENSALSGAQALAARLASVIGTHARSPQAQRLHQSQPDALSADAPGFMICPNLLAPQQRAGFLCRINFLSLSNATGQTRLQRGLFPRGPRLLGRMPARVSMTIEIPRRSPRACMRVDAARKNTPRWGIARDCCTLR